MKSNCPFSETVMDLWFQKQKELDAAAHEHLNTCTPCSQLIHRLNAWSADRVEDRPYFTQKVMAMIAPKDRHYARNSTRVARSAFSMAMLVGVVLGYFFTRPSTTEVPDNEQLISEYRQKIDLFSTETYYNEIKTEETQQLLTDLNN